jgi:hypothetical protein
MDTRLVNPHDCQYVQSRAALDVFAVAEYEDMMERGIVFEPCTGILCEDGAIIIYDGNHRAEAAKGNGAMLEVNLTPGTAQDANWQASGANTRHGLRRTASDIEKSVKAALCHPNAQGLSDREIARHCGCDHKTVGKYRKELETSGERPQIPVKTVTRNGTEYQMTIPMPKDPEPSPSRNPSPVVFDAHMHTAPKNPQAKASIEMIQDLVKTWLFDVYGYDVETAREKLHAAICAPIQHAEHFYALAVYVEARLICTRSDIRQACQALLDNTDALRRQDSMPTVPGVDAQGHTVDRKVIEARCMDCGEPFPRPEDRPDLKFCYDCSQARLGEHERKMKEFQQQPVLRTCSFCGEKFNMPEGLYVSHQPSSISGICAQCVMKAAREISRYDDIAKPYSCPDCGYTFQAVAVKFYADDDTEHA